MKGRSSSEVLLRRTSHPRGVRVFSFVHNELVIDFPNVCTTVRLTPCCTAADGGLGSHQLPTVGAPVATGAEGEGTPGRLADENPATNVSHPNPDDDANATDFELPWSAGTGECGLFL